MKKNNIIFVLLVGLVFNLTIYADSPLISNAISEAYQDIPIVNKAGKANGKLNSEIMEYISNPDNPIDIKMAVINALVWLSETSEEDEYVLSLTYLDFLIESKKYADEKDFQENGTGDELLAMAYFLGIHFSVGIIDDKYIIDKSKETIDKKAFKYTDLALQKNPQSWTYNIIVRLIKAEKYHYSSDKQCEAFTITDEIRNPSDLTFDMRPKAKELIFRYMDQYQEDCPQ